jgi:hypothetical protein
MSMKNSNDTIGNRTRDLLACSALPQPSAPHLKYGTVENYRILMLFSVSIGAPFLGVKLSGREPHLSSPSNA